MSNAEKGVTFYNAEFIPQCVGESEQIIAGLLAKRSRIPGDRARSEQGPMISVHMPVAKMLLAAVAGRVVGPAFALL